MVERGVVRGVLHLVDAEQVVGGGALGGEPARVPDEPAQLRGRHQLAVGGARRGGDRFVDQGAAHVVGPRGEQDLGELRAFLHPRALDVTEERPQEEPGERVHLDDLETGRALTDARDQPPPVHRGLLVDQGQGHELGEATGVLLDAAQQVHVADPVGGLLHVPIHDGGGGPDALRVGGGDHLDPLLDRDATARDEIADVLVQHLGGGAGERAEPRLLELGEVLRDRQPGAGRPIQDLFRREGVQVHLGQRRLDRAAEIDVVAPVELRGQAGLDADLGRAHLPRLDGAADHLVHREEVAFLLAVVAAERTEGAMLDAHVREVDVAVDDVGDHVARLAVAHLVRDQGEGLEVAPVGLGQPDAVVHRQLAPVEETTEDAADVGGSPVERDRGRVLVVHHQCLHTSRSGLT